MLPIWRRMNYSTCTNKRLLMNGKYGESVSPLIWVAEQAFGTGIPTGLS